jgi:hypothetical protein
MRERRSWLLRHGHRAATPKKSGQGSARAMDSLFSVVQARPVHFDQPILNRLLEWLHLTVHLLDVES